MASVLPGCSPAKTPPPSPDTTAPTTTETAINPVYTGPPIETASASAPEPTASTAATSTVPPPASTEGVTRTDIGANYWDLSGAAVADAHNPGKPRPVSSKPTPGPTMNMPTCPTGFVCGREPATLSGSAAPSPFGKCETQIEPPKHQGDSLRFSAGATTFERKADPTACCYHWFTPCPGGRPLRDVASEAIVANVITRDGWVTTSIAAGRAAADLDDTARAMVATHWAREAAFEHASVASFSVASLELLAIGAPADLVKGAHEAALDEIEHARRCFDLASRYGGVARGPAPLPLGRDLVARSPEDIARKTLRDACINETIAALMASRAAEGAIDARVKETLDVIAVDEARHAELGWRTLSWLVSTFADEALPIVRAEAAALREELALGAGVAPGASGAASRALRAHGMISADEVTRVRHEALSAIVLPCLDGLISRA